VDDVVSDDIVVCSDESKRPAPFRPGDYAKVGTMTGEQKPNPRESIVSPSQTEPSYSAEDDSFLG